MTKFVTKSVGLLKYINLIEWVKVWVWYILMHMLGQWYYKLDFFSLKVLYEKNEMNTSHICSKCNVSWEKNDLQEILHHCYLLTCLQMYPDALPPLPCDGRAPEASLALGPSSFLRTQGGHSCHPSFSLPRHQVILFKNEIFILLTYGFYFFYIINKNKTNKPNNNKHTPLLTPTLFLLASAPLYFFFFFLLLFREKLLENIGYSLSLLPKYLELTPNWFSLSAMLVDVWQPAFWRTKYWSIFRFLWYKSVLLPRLISNYRGQFQAIQHWKRHAQLASSRFYCFFFLLIVLVN